SAIEVTIHRHEMEKQLRGRERWFATTLRSIDDAVVTVDVDGNIAFVNPAAERLLGAAGDQAIGQPAGELMRLGDPGQPASPLAVVLANSSYLRSELDDVGVALRSTDESDRELAERIRELSEVHSEISAAGLRIGKIVADLKAFSRPSGETAGAADVGSAISW